MTRKTKPPKSTGRTAPAPPGQAPLSKAQQEADRRLDEQLDESFPASDPPSILRRK